MSVRHFRVHKKPGVFKSRRHIGNGTKQNTNRHNEKWEEMGSWELVLTPLFDFAVYSTGLIFSSSSSNAFLTICFIPYYSLTFTGFTLVRHRIICSNPEPFMMRSVFICVQSNTFNPLPLHVYVSLQCHDIFK